MFVALGLGLLAVNGLYSSEGERKVRRSEDLTSILPGSEGGSEDLTSILAGSEGSSEDLSKAVYFGGPPIDSRVQHLENTVFGSLGLTAGYLKGLVDKVKDLELEVNRIQKQLATEEEGFEIIKK